MAVDASRRVFVVLGVFRPDRDLFRLQIESLLAQSHADVIVVVSPDGPLDDADAALVSEYGDSRFTLLNNADRLGIHANFARGLNAALAGSDRETDLFAFCDQDDFWHPNKIERQVARLADSSVSLCHGDARIVSRDGEVLALSLFAHESRPRTATLADLLVANSVTGMTAMFRRDVAGAASAFPMSSCRHMLHDHWTALVAALMGTICLIEEPLVDYVQHGESVMGAKPGQGMLSIRGGIVGDANYRSRCYRQYLWRRRAYGLLLEQFGHIPGVVGRLSTPPLRMLFDCQTSHYAGFALSAAYRLRGRWREADQVWRLAHGKAMYCSRRARTEGG